MFSWFYRKIGLSKWLAFMMFRLAVWMRKKLLAAKTGLKRGKL